MALLFMDDCIKTLQTFKPESIDLLVTDPPYRLVGGGQTSCGNTLHGILFHGDELSQKGKLFQHNDIGFSEWLPSVYRVLKPGAHAYIFTNPRNLHGLQTAAEKAGFTFQNLIVWKKNNKIACQYYMMSYELILFIRKGPAKYINNISTPNLLSVKNITNGTKLHPTEKPVELLKILIENSSKKNDIVLDPFMGCGGTGVACNETGRHFIGMEIDPQYFEVALRRVDAEASETA